MIVPIYGDRGYVNRLGQKDTFLLNEGKRIQSPKRRVLIKLWRWIMYKEITILTIHHRRKHSEIRPEVDQKIGSSTNQLGPAE
jgi:hypothetical protein